MKFRLLGVPIHVDPGFLIVAGMLGAGRGDLWLVLVWVAVVFVSILVHELGHAWAARSCGMQPAISLYFMGGLTHWREGSPLTHLQHIAISLAGPFAGFALGSLVLAAAGSIPTTAPYLLHQAMRDLLWVNFGWGLLNLLPILPLDGGNVLRSALHAVRGHRDERTPLQVSIGVGVLGALAALNYGMLWAAMLCGFITYNNYGALRRVG